MATVGVIFGGRSVEHDVSIVTAHQVMAALSERHEVVPIYVTRDGEWYSSPGLNDLDVYKRGAAAEVGEPAFIPPVPRAGLHIPGGRLRGAKTIALDVVIPAVHGTYGEDGTLQGVLELADLPYVGCDVVASALGMDKVAMKRVFRAAALPVVDDVLVERAMEGCIEVNCSVVGGPGREARASVCEQPVAWEEFLTFSDKYLRGAKDGAAAKGGGMAGQERRIPAPISDELTRKVQENALGAFTAIGAAGVARVDSFVNEQTGETWVMEINTVPGSFAFYLWEASGVPFSDLLEELIDIAYARHNRRSELLFSFDSGMLDGAARGAKTGG